VVIINLVQQPLFRFTERIVCGVPACKDYGWQQYQVEADNGFEDSHMAVLL
jgi:hypothetical protein